MFSYRQLQRLEERLSIQIFERTSKNVRLTGDGKAFCDEALALLAQLEDMAFSCDTPRDILQVHPALRLELIATDRLGDILGRQLGFTVWRDSERIVGNRGFISHASRIHGILPLRPHAFSSEGITP